MKKIRFNSKMLPWGKKKILPVLGLALLTIGLIFLFKYKSLDLVVHEQAGNIVDFYTQNLKPLIVKTSISKEDVFNFAFYRELPLDKQGGQYLKLGNEKNGKEYFEFREASFSPQTNNLEHFADALKLNKEQKLKVDSILNSYKDRLEKQVLVNDKNTLAINSNLWKLNRAILADLLMFASSANKEKFRELMPLQNDFIHSASMPQMISELKNAENNRYIFVTHDSIFAHNYDYSRQPDLTPQGSAAASSQGKAAGKVMISFDRDLAKVYSKPDKHRDFQIKIDTNFCRIQIPAGVIAAEAAAFSAEKMNEAMAQVTSELGNISINMRPPIPPAKKGKTKFKINVGTTSPPGDPESFELNINLPNVDSIIRNSLKSIPASDREKIKSLGVNIDSLAGNFSISTDDSMSPEELQKLKADMKKLKDEMRKNKADMKRNNAEMKKNLKKRTENPRPPAVPADTEEAR